MGGTSWPGTEPVELAQHTSTYEYDGSGNVIYIGRALPGTAKTATGWQIQKLTWSGTTMTDIQWANGTRDYTAIWNDRASLSYS